MSTSHQKSLIKDFKNITGATDKQATELLKSNGWDLNSAMDSYYQKNPKAAPAVKKGDVGKLGKIFDEYVDPDQKENLFDAGLARFLKDIGVSDDGLESLALSWRLDCQEQGTISRKEFVEGFAKLGADTIPKMKAEVEKLKKELTDKRAMKAFNAWLFDYCTEKKRKVIDKAMALGLWALILKNWPLSQKWIEFCTNLDEKNLKAVSKDLWLQVYDFSLEVKPDLADYDPDAGAWPFVIDLFVEHVKASKK